MDANTVVDLTKLHQAIVSDIAAAFPSLATVEFYREERTNLPVPACILELTELEALGDDDPGTEQLAVLAKFEASLIISFRSPTARLSVRLLAAALSAWLRHQRWTDPDNPTKKLPTGAAQVIGAFPDDFRAVGMAREQDLPQFEIWRVEWQQIVHLGASVWLPDGSEIVPGEVYSVGRVDGVADSTPGQVVP